MPNWEFPALTGITSTPFIHANGDLIAVEGFDPGTGWMLMNLPKMPPIPGRPSQAEAADALKKIAELIKEFPFTDKVDQSIGLSLLLTATLRPTLNGPVPLFAFSSPEPGSGKSYLADLAAILATNELCPAVAATRNAEELEKKLTGSLLSAHPLINVDNLNRQLSSDLLAQACERPMLHLRPLGSSKMHLIPNAVTLIVNGNNLRVVNDLVRRTLRCELDANTERPEERTFTSDPIAMVRTDRGVYIAAALLAARAYITAGYPDRPTPLPSFGRWSDLIRGLLLWLGYADPVESIARSREDDPNKQSLAVVLEYWPTDQARYTTEELMKRATEESILGEPLRPDFLAGLRAVATDRTGRLTTTSLGYWLRSQKGRVCGPWKLAQDGPANRREWFRLDRRGNGMDDASGFTGLDPDQPPPDQTPAAEDEAPL